MDQLVPLLLGVLGIKAPADFHGVPVPAVTVTKGLAAAAEPREATLALASVPVFLGMARVLLAMEPSTVRSDLCHALAAHVFDASKLLDPNLYRVHSPKSEESTNKSPGVVAARCIQVALHAAAAAAGFETGRPLCTAGAAGASIRNILRSVRIIGYPGEGGVACPVTLACSDLALTQLLHVFESLGKDLERPTTTLDLQLPLSVVLCAITTGASTGPLVAVCERADGSSRDALGCLGTVDVEMEPSVLEPREAVPRLLLVRVARQVLQGLVWSGPKIVNNCIAWSDLAGLYSVLLDNMPDLGDLLVELLKPCAAEASPRVRPWLWDGESSMAGHILSRLPMQNRKKTALHGDLRAFWAACRRLCSAMAATDLWTKLETGMGVIVGNHFLSWCEVPDRRRFADDATYEAASYAAHARAAVVSSTIVNVPELAAAVPDAVLQAARDNVAAQGVVTPVGSVGSVGWISPCPSPADDDDNDDDDDEDDEDDEADPVHGGAPGPCKLKPELTGQSPKKRQRTEEADEEDPAL